MDGGSKVLRRVLSSVLVSAAVLWGADASGVPQKPVSDEVRAQLVVEGPKKVLKEKGSTALVKDIVSAVNGLDEGFGLGLTGRQKDVWAAHATLVSQKLNGSDLPSANPFDHVFDEKGHESGRGRKLRYMMEKMRAQIQAMEKAIDEEDKKFKGGHKANKNRRKDGRPYEMMVLNQDPKGAQSHRALYINRSPRQRIGR